MHVALARQQVFQQVAADESGRARHEIGHVDSPPDMELATG
jgi:hypothetical protein